MKFTQFLGFGLGVLFYFILIILILLYLILTIFKNKALSKVILLTSFYHSLISILAITYGLVLLNGGYDLIILDLDYSIMLIFLIVIFIFISISVPYHKEFTITFKLLPYAVFVVLSFCSIIFYFLCHYCNFILNL